MPLQLGLAVQIHNLFGSRFLVDTVYNLGFCSSYSEVMKYEAAAAKTWDIEVDNSERNHSIQFVADNVDHNLDTLDGHNTFHGVGIIATITPSIKLTNQYLE